MMIMITAFSFLIHKCYNNKFWLFVQDTRRYTQEEDDAAVLKKWETAIKSIIVHNKYTSYKIQMNLRYLSSVGINYFPKSSKAQRGLFRFLSSTNWGFESSPSADSDEERALVERCHDINKYAFAWLFLWDKYTLFRSCRRGCSAIITRTSLHSTSIHQLLADLEVQ